MMSRPMLSKQISAALEELTRKQVAVIINTIFENMKEALSRGEKIEIRGFGIFKLKDRKARIARNPKTGEKVAISARKTVHFKASKTFNNDLNTK